MKQHMFALLYVWTTLSLTTSTTGFVLPNAANTRRFTLQAESEKAASPAKGKRRNKPKKITIQEMQKEMMRNYDKVLQEQKTSKKSRRTRKRVENPKQSYAYAAQRQQKKNENVDDKESEESPVVVEDEFSPIVQARRLGLSNAANQHSQALIDEVEPVILGKLRVGEESDSGEYAYLIQKPAGWSILGGGGSIGGKKKQQREKPIPSKQRKDKSQVKRVKFKGEDGSEDTLEIREEDALALLSPEERAELEAEGGSIFDGLSGKVYYDQDEDIDYPPGWYDVQNMTPEERSEAEIEEEDWDSTTNTDNMMNGVSEADILALLTPKERAQYEEDKQLATQTATTTNKLNKRDAKYNPLERYHDIPRDELDPTVQDNLNRIETRMSKNKSEKATFSTNVRPSIVAWLKELKEEEGTPIRGGNFWTAVAGATDVDDSGVVLICPKSNVQNLFVDRAEYVAVIGNGQFLAPKQKKEAARMEEAPVDMSIVGKVRKGREGDTCQTVKVTIPEQMSTCSSIVTRIQDHFADGIRGDPAANPFDRRAPRRLIHCKALAASSLLFDENVNAETERLPDDIAILTHRLNYHKYVKGSFLGRSELRDNPLTNAYREINGAADGFPGWTVDRYGEWLFVQHDEKEYKGPLPSIHDGSTAGVYYLPANPDRGAMGANQNVRPTLLEGRPVRDEIIPVLENGITYHVSLDKDLSTGLFLDQRLHRAWLSQNCNEDTHVLNCFAHCGAFSIAAAAAGASTLSLDLNKKWLDRVQPQLEANGIEFDGRHDCIYGDCK